MKYKVLEEVNGRGYVGLKVDPRYSERFVNIMRAIGIEDFIAPEDMHVTLIYDKDNPNLDYQPEPRSYKGVITGAKVMGKPDSEYRAIALIIESGELQEKHEQLKEVGFKHSYDEFLPHVSLKYKPTDDDIKAIDNTIELFKFMGFNILLNSEWVQSLK